LLKELPQLRLLWGGVNPKASGQAINFQGEVCPVVPLFDIFRVEVDGTLIWCGSATTLELAKVRVVEIRNSAPSEYMIVSAKTGTRITIPPPSNGFPMEQA
jgi:hypothetical protein